MATWAHLRARQLRNPLGEAVSIAVEWLVSIPVHRTPFCMVDPMPIFVTGDASPLALRRCTAVHFACLVDKIDHPSFLCDTFQCARDCPENHAAPRYQLLSPAARFGRPCVGLLPSASKTH